MKFNHTNTHLLIRMIYFTPTFETEFCEYFRPKTTENLSLNFRLLKRALTLYLLFNVWSVNVSDEPVRETLSKSLKSLQVRKRSGSDCYQHSVISKQMVDYFISTCPKGLVSVKVVISLFRMRLLVSDCISFLKFKSPSDFN